MKISDVQAFLMSSPMPDPVIMPFYGGVRTIYKRDGLLVKISTDGGVAGFGPGPAAESFADTINSEVRDLLLDQDPAKTEIIKKKMGAADSHQVRAALGAVEVALYDLRGKMEGCPVYELLGGKKQDRVRVYGSAGMYQSPEDYALEAAEIKNLGYSAYKYRPALGPDEDLRTVQLMSEALGPDVGICIDAHAWWRMGDRSYTPESVENLAHEISNLNITWLEEPLPYDDRNGYRELREKRIVPIAAGEHENSLKGFLEIIEGGCVDIAQADVPHHGGFSGVRDVLVACEENGIEFAFHNWGTELETIADAQLGCCFTREVCGWLEYPEYSHRGRDIMYPFPLSDDILTERLSVENGELIIPDGPGLGVEVDENVIEKYPYIDGPWSIFELDSPPQKMALSGDHSVAWDTSVT